MDSDGIESLVKGPIIQLLAFHGYLNLRVYANRLCLFPVHIVLLLRQVYQLAFFTPGIRPARAFIRN